MNHYTVSKSIKRDCVNFEKGGCRALDKDYCAIEPCKFYKTKKMADEQIARIRKRIPDYGSENYV